MPNYFENIKRYSTNYSYRQTSVFFRPFQNTTDFLETLVSPIAAPILLGTLAILSAVGAVATLACGVGILALGIIVTPLILCVPEVPFIAFSVGINLCFSALELAIDVIKLAVGIVLCAAINTTAIFTRSAASIVDGLSNCCGSEDQTLYLIN